jgi:hypothetical protein
MKLLKILQDILLQESKLLDLVTITPYNDPEDEYGQDLDQYLEEDGIDWRKESRIELLDPYKIEPSEWNSLSNNPNNPKSIRYSKEPLDKFPPIIALQTGNNTYQAIDGIHRVYAFRLRNYKIPAIVITPKLEKGLNTTDSRVESFLFTKYKDASIPKPEAL